MAAASSSHTAWWANGLSALGHKIHVVSQHPIGEVFSPDVEMHLFPQRGAIGYFTMVPGVRKLLNVIRPDLVNAHYASGYGTTARLVGHHPWLLSVWGSDVYEFPYKSVIHKWLVRKNLSAADKVASTSRCMSDQTRSLEPGLSDIELTPFGVDLRAYPSMVASFARNKEKIVIGTVKSMKPVYGIDLLIESFALLVGRLADRDGSSFPQLELHLIGGGEQLGELRSLAERLGVAEYVFFKGKVPHSQVPSELSRLDIFVALSRSESFGVAVLEAGASGLPVVVSDRGGLPEVTLDGKTGIVVPAEDPHGAADALEKLVLDPDLRYWMGGMAQRHVAESYSREFCLRTMISAYENTIHEFEKGN